MIWAYGIGLAILLILALILVWKLGTIGFIILILGSLFLLSGKKTA